MKIVKLLMAALISQMIFSTDCIAQLSNENIETGLSLSHKTPDQKFSFLKPPNDFKNIHFGFGLELALGGAFGTEGEVYPGFIGFIDLNLSNRILFLKAEYGRLFFLKKEAGYNYASIGFNYKVVEGRKHNFYVHGAAIGLWSQGQVMPTAVSAFPLHSGTAIL